MKRTFIAAALLAVMAGVAHADGSGSGSGSAGAGSGSDTGVTERARLEVQPAGKAFTKLAIDNPLGDVRIEGYDGTALQIETRKHAPNAAAMDRLRISLVPNADGTVSISTTADGGREAAPLSRGGAKIDLVIRAPHAVHVEASVSSGMLEVQDIDGGGELDSASGAINARNISGEIITHTLSGATNLTQMFGIVDAQALTSDMMLDQITGDRLVASIGHGRMTGRRVRSREIQLTTTDAKIVLEAEVALRGKLVVSSISGDLDIKVRRHGALLVRARGTKVDLGSLMAQATPAQNGWMSLAVSGDGEPAAVELSSRSGIVRFAFVQ